MSSNASSLRDFEVLSKIGDGAFSQVFKVRRRSDGQIYALKKVKMEALNNKEKENALNEVRILASLNDPYIVSYKECFIEAPTNCLCLILEFCNGGDILSLIMEKVKKRQLFSEDECWNYLI